MTAATTRSPVGSGTSAFSRASAAWDSRLKTVVYILAAGSIALALWFATVEAATLLLHPGNYASRYFGIRMLPFTRESRRSRAGSGVETAGADWRPIADRHVAEKAVTMSVLSLPHNPLTNRRRTAKLALLFVTDQGRLPLKRVWERFFQAELKGPVELEHDNSKFSVYVHSGGNEMRYNADEGRFFQRNDIPSLPAHEGTISMVDAQRRLLAWALLDPDNHFFLFLDHSCIPIRGFAHIYSSLLHSRHSFVAMADDPSAYPPELAPLWVAVNRPHATAIVADNMFYRAFKHHCKGAPAASSESDRGAASSALASHAHLPACQPDEHYIATFLRTVDPDGVANFTITHESHMGAAAAMHEEMRREAQQRARMRRRQQRREEGETRGGGGKEGQGGEDGTWQLRRQLQQEMQQGEVVYGAVNITSRFIMEIQDATAYFHQTARLSTSPTACRWNGQLKPCFMFARPFRPDAVDEIMSILPNVLNY
ncbi:hypothetical protein CLOM_g21331 [Closterium sp. NIES-68]|nr:hypothetical protein CLOM_g21331 [Closterium sp. NIES-68]GJP71929.1 hypothetical protein CLOP_g2715 [Closterium sp. NIES-67]